MAKQSSSDLVMHENTVEKQIEEANLLIERVMAALREIKMGITQYRITSRLSAMEACQDPSIAELKARLEDKCKSAQCPEECVRSDIQSQVDAPSEVDVPSQRTQPDEPEKIPEPVIKYHQCIPATCPVKSGTPPEPDAVPQPDEPKKIPEHVTKYRQCIPVTCPVKSGTPPEPDAIAQPDEPEKTTEHVTKYRQCTPARCPVKSSSPPEPDAVPKPDEPEKTPEHVTKYRQCIPARCPVKQKASYQVPAEKPLVDLEAQEIASEPEPDDAISDDAASDHDTLSDDAQNDVVGTDAENEVVTDDAEDDHAVEDDATKELDIAEDEAAKDDGVADHTSRKKCPCKKEPQISEPTTGSLDMLKAKLDLISEAASSPSCKKDQGTTDVDAPQKEERASKVSGKANAVEDTMSATLLRKCLNCLQMHTISHPCICANIAKELLAADGDDGSPRACTSILDKLKRLQVQTIPPVSIKGGLVVQKVMEIAIKPSGSTDVTYDPQGNIGYESVNMEEMRDNSSRNPVSFLTLELDKSVQISFDIIRDRTINELKELRERMQQHSTLEEDDDDDFGGTKLHVLQSFQVLNSLEVGHVPEDDPLAMASVLSGSIDVQVYKTFIDPNVEIIGVGDFLDIAEDEVEFARVRRTSLKACGSTLIATKSKEKTNLKPEHEMDHDVQSKTIPEVEEDWDIDEEGSCSSSGSATHETSMVDEITTQTEGSLADESNKPDDQEDEDDSEQLPTINTLIPKVCQEDEQKANKLGSRSPFELGIYENKAIQCGSSHIPVIQNKTTQGGTQMSDVSSSESTITQSSFTSQCSSSAGEGTRNRGIQVSFTEVSEEDEARSKAKPGHLARDIEYVSSEEDIAPSAHNAASNEAVSEFLTGLTEKSANKIDVYSKSHGNLTLEDVSVSGVEMDTVSVATLDLDENAQMLKNLVHDPSAKKLISKQSTIYKHMITKSAESTSQCCQVEFDKVDIWQPKTRDKEELLSNSGPSSAAAKEDYARNLHQGELRNTRDITPVQKSPRLLSSDTHSKRYTLDISASEPTTMDDSLSEGEYRCKCSVSSGEIHICPFSKDMRTKVKYLRKHQRKLYKKDARDPKLDIVAQRSFYNNWLNYYADSDNPTTNNDTSNNTEL